MAEICQKVTLITEFGKKKNSYLISPNFNFWRNLSPQFCLPATIIMALDKSVVNKVEIWLRLRYIFSKKLDWCEPNVSPPPQFHGVTQGEIIHKYI